MTTIEKMTWNIGDKIQWHTSSPSGMGFVDTQKGTIKGIYDRQRIINLRLDAEEVYKQLVSFEGGL